MTVSGMGSVLANQVERPRPRCGPQRPAHTAWMRPAAFSPRLRECHALAGELGALRPIETTGFAVAADGPRTVADARA
jgi:hypothetical protein